MGFQHHLMSSSKGQFKVVSFHRLSVLYRKERPKALHPSKYLWRRGYSYSPQSPTPTVTSPDRSSRSAKPRFTSHRILSSQVLRHHAAVSIRPDPENLLLCELVDVPDGMFEADSRLVTQDPARSGPSEEEKKPFVPPAGIWPPSDAHSHLPCWRRSHSELERWRFEASPWHRAAARRLPGHLHHLRDTAM